MRFCVNAEQATPTFFCFVVTNEQGVRHYGSCLIIYEEVSKELNQKLKSMFYVEKLTVYSPKALCIISNYSFITQFREILKQVYRLHLSKSTIPIERYICNLTDEIPIPIKGKTVIEYEIGAALVSFCRPLDQIQPYASVKSNVIIE